MPLYKQLLLDFICHLTIGLVGAGLTILFSNPSVAQAFEPDPDSLCSPHNAKQFLKETKKCQPEVTESEKSELPEDSASHDPAVSDGK